MDFRFWSPSTGKRRYSLKWVIADRTPPPCTSDGRHKWRNAFGITVLYNLFVSTLVTLINGLHFDLPEWKYVRLLWYFVDDCKDKNNCCRLFPRRSEKPQFHLQVRTERPHCVTGRGTTTSYRHWTSRWTVETKTYFCNWNRSLYRNYNFLVVSSTYWYGPPETCYDRNTWSKVLCWSREVWAETSGVFRRTWRRRRSRSRRSSGPTTSSSMRSTSFGTTRTTRRSSSSWGGRQGHRCDTRHSRRGGSMSIPSVDGWKRTSEWIGRRIAPHPRSMTERLRVCPLRVEVGLSQKHKPLDFP